MSTIYRFNLARVARLAVPILVLLFVVSRTGAFAQEPAPKPPATATQPGQPVETPATTPTEAVPVVVTETTTIPAETAVLTPTETVEPTPTPEPSTEIPLPTDTDTPTPAPQAGSTGEPPQTPEGVEEALPEAPGVPPALLQQIRLPFLAYQPGRSEAAPVERITTCKNPNLPIPDDNPGGTTDVHFISSSKVIQDLEIYLDISHTYIGDIAVSLSHQDTGRSIQLVRRPVNPSTGKRCSYKNIKTILDDDVALPINEQCLANPLDIYGNRMLPAAAGIFVPYQPLSSFDGESIGGNWVLNVADLDDYDTGTLKSWCITAALVEEYQVPPSPVPQPLPAQAQVRGVQGYDQALPLDCEARVAVDWAAFFGVKIGEFAFFNQLPKSDNPDAGFVGNVNGTWGQIPPNPYGIHAEPVAALLREYGLPAYAHRSLSWDALRAEIAAGRPVYVWVIGAVSSPEVPIYYQSKDGHVSVVAHFEHTVQVSAYTEKQVTIRDGSKTYTRLLDDFLRSWSALQNMAITTRP